MEWREGSLQARRAPSTTWQEKGCSGLQLRAVGRSQDTSGRGVDARIQTRRRCRCVFQGTVRGSCQAVHDSSGGLVTPIGITRQMCRAGSRGSGPGRHLDRDLGRPTRGTPARRRRREFPSTRLRLPLRGRAWLTTGTVGALSPNYGCSERLAAGSPRPPTCTRTLSSAASRSA